MVDFDTYAALKKIESKEDGDWWYPSYEDLFAAGGLTVEAYKMFGSYQGDAIAVVSDGQRKGIAVFGYGSCSGCDALEAAQPWFDEPKDWSKMNSLAESMISDIKWADGRTLGAVAAALIDDKYPADWFVYDVECKDFLQSLIDAEG